MTNLERAAALAAERDWPLVETYRGWAVYRDGRYLRGAYPHELSPRQAATIAWSLGWTVVADDISTALAAGVSDVNMGMLHKSIDSFEAAREAMPATAFFGVPEEVAL